MRLVTIICSLVLAAAGTAHASSTTKGMPPDPLDSPSWDVMYELFLDGEPVEFDGRVQVLSPDSAEDSMAVPVSVRTDLDDVEQILVFSDLNPIPQVLRYYPVAGSAYIAFRMKLQQASPIRAAVKTADGVWHVGGKWVDALGGGCTAPSVGMTSGNWPDTLGDVAYARWHKDDGDRVRMRIMHPMDTGLAPGIPAFHIEHLELRDADGTLLARIETYEPVSENPVLSIDLRGARLDSTVLSLSGVDNNGNPVDARLEP